METTNLPTETEADNTKNDTVYNDRNDKLFDIDNTPPLKIMGRIVYRKSLVSLVVYFIFSIIITALISPFMISDNKTYDAVNVLDNKDIYRTEVIPTITEPILNTNKTDDSNNSNSPTINFSSPVNTISPTKTFRAFNESAGKGANPLLNNIYLNTTDNPVGKLKWKTKFGISTPPVAANDYVYAVGYDSKFYLLDTYSGAIVWTYPLEGVGSQEVAVQNTVVYIGDLKGILYALDVEKKSLLWKYSTTYSKKGSNFTGESSIFSPITVYNGLIFFSDNSGKFYALDALTGLEKWKFEKPLTWTVSLPAFNDTTCYIATDNGYVYALNIFTGNIIWEKVFPTMFFTHLVVDKEILFLTGENQTLYALNRLNAQIIWRYTYPVELKWIGVSAQSPATFEDKVFISGTNDNQLDILNLSTGVKIASLKANNWIESTPSIGKDTLYFGTNDRINRQPGTVYAFDINNLTEKWRYELDKDQLVDPIYLYKNMLFFKDTRGILYALE